MKTLITLTLLAGLSVTGAALAQQNQMKDMHQNMPMDMHQGMMGKQSEQKAETHHATGTVKSAAPEKGTVTLVHGPVKSLNWPGMTMKFVVQDKALYAQLKEGQKVAFDFEKQGAKYLITKVR